MLSRQCDPVDRLCRDNSEFEGPSSGGGGGSPPAAAVAWDPMQVALTALLPLLLVVLLNRFRYGGGGRRQHLPGAKLPHGGRHFVRASAAAEGAGIAAHALQASPPAGGQGGSRGGALVAASDAVAAALLLPLSMLQHGLYLAGLGSAPHGRAAPGGPLGAPAAQAATPESGARFGLGLGEAESEEEEWGEGLASEATEGALRRLQATPEFRAFLQARGLTAGDVSASMSRLRLYRRLRALDPPAFWQLLRPGSRTAFQSRAPSRQLLAAEYLLSTAATLAAPAAAAYLFAAAPALPTALRAAAAAVPLCAAAAPWLRARPTAGGLFGMWYEEPVWGHSAPAWRCVAATLLDAAYVAGSAGLGAAISLWLRCVSGRRQSVGELLAGVHAVQEVELAQPGEEQEEGERRGGKPG